MQVFDLFPSVAQTLQGQNYLFNFPGTLSGDRLFYQCQPHLYATFRQL